MNTPADVKGIRCSQCGGPTTPDIDMADPEEWFGWCEKCGVGTFANETQHHAVHRRCETCGAAMPNRTHRQRNSKGQLVCDSCTDRLKASWAAVANTPEVQAEMLSRTVEARESIARVYLNKQTKVAHDSGDMALLNHCPFCGSGSITGRSDGSVECDFCNSVFTVQVQPAHPNMPQTVDGQPVTPPGMPAGQESELSSTDDPSVAESEDGVAANPLDDDDPTKPKNPNPFAKGQPGKGGPPQAGDKAVDPTKKKSVPPWLKDKKSSRTADFNYNPGPIQNPIPVDECPHNEWTAVKSIGPGRYELYRCEQCGGRWRIYDTSTDDWGEPSWHPSAAKPPTTAAFRTATGATLRAEDYMAHLALSFADDREAVLDNVRIANLQRKAIGEITCPLCNGLGAIPPDGEDCPVCNGEGMLMWSDIDIFRSRLEEAIEEGWGSPQERDEAHARLQDLNRRYPVGA